jgi:peroxiredoxin
LIYTDRIRGVGLNDVFVVGDFGLVAHFNGFSWRIIPDANVALNHSIDYKNNLMLSVGQRNQKAVILIGKR